MPIGNYQDITLRMLDAINTADVIFCESIGTFKMQCHEAGWKTHAELIEYNYINKSPEQMNIIHNKVVNALSLNKKVLVVSEYGCMFIEDPGASLFEKIVESGYEITILPGPSIVTTAYVAAGIDSPDNTTGNTKRGSFIFQPFFMISDEEKINILTALKDGFRTMVFLDRNQNMVSLMNNINDIFGDRLITLAFNLTTPNEKIYRGRTKEMLEVVKSFYSEKHLYEPLLTIICKGTDEN